MLKEPELLETFKKRNEFEGKSAIDELKEKKGRMENSLKVIKKDITNILTLIKKNPDGPAASRYQEQLEKLSLDKKERLDELEFSK